MADNESIRALEKLGNIRRQLNLTAVKLLRNYGLHPKQVVMLRFVSEQGEVSLTELARGTATDMAAASRAIGPLIKQGWLKKVRDPEDSRRWIICLTPKAERKMPGIEKVYAKLAAMFSAPLAPRERKDLSRLLERVLVHLQENLQE